MTTKGKLSLELLDQEASHSNENTTGKMASNTLGNLRACVSEFDPDQTTDIQNMSKRYVSWLENFEACTQFEEVPNAKMKPALMAIGGEKLRELCKSLGVTAGDSDEEAKAKLETHFTPKKIHRQKGLSF